MQNLLGFTVTGKAKHDDAPDAVAMLCQLAKDLSGLSIKISDRRSLRFNYLHAKSSVIFFSVENILLKLISLVFNHGI